MLRSASDPVHVSATILAGPFDLENWFGPNEDDQLRLTVEAVMRKLLDCRLWLVPREVSRMGRLTIGTICTNRLSFPSAIAILSRLPAIEYVEGSLARLEQELFGEPSP